MRKTLCLLLIFGLLLSCVACVTVRSTEEPLPTVTSTEPTATGTPPAGTTANQTTPPATTAQSTTPASTPPAATTPAPVTVPAMPESFDLPVEDVPELLPDVLSVRSLEYDGMPILATQEEVTLYALWNFLWGRTEFECYLTRELAPDDGRGYDVLDKACTNMGAYYLFSAFQPFNMFTTDRGDEQGVYGKVTLRFVGEAFDLEARAEALEYVMKHPVPVGGFTDYESERNYVKQIHDFLACKVTYAPIGYNPKEMDSASDRYESKQEAYTSLGEDQNSTVCAGYARGFALIAHYAGINAAWVWGNETETDSHAWNILYPCDGSEPVLIDVTWDDSNYLDVEGQTEVDYSWFYIPLSEVYDHTPEPTIAAFLNYVNDAQFTVQ